ncbi:tRNA adenosine(34) deaminase TadA [Eremococcus coleocola]|uniref:tRNA adenosine(34) deaminase TadA n=1 Tax=Eremococcus coleocola TaxID=88132 RepID=UPI00042518A8|nr:tRNA adenosine(34) deaminase TadA [Eremococcus coleocola]
MIHVDQLLEADRIHHETWMQEALKEADKALVLDEVPIGAVLVYQGQIVGRGHNVRESQERALGHAELMAIETANQQLGHWRLEEASLYVTLEPCPMCAGALMNCRIKEVIYGASDLKAGCAGTLMNLLEEDRFNHRAQVIQGVLEQECSHKLSQFFKDLRQRKKMAKARQTEHKE